jgi:hypothetical protein
LVLGHKYHDRTRYQDRKINIKRPKSWSDRKGKSIFQVGLQAEVSGKLRYRATSDGKSHSSPGSPELPAGGEIREPGGGTSG